MNCKRNCGFFDTMLKYKMSKNNKKRIVLLDSHAILHRAYHALPEFTSTKGEPTGALYGLCLMLLKIINELKPNYIIACFDLPKPTYRHEMYEGYKAKRAKADDALIQQIKKSREIFDSFSIPIYEKEGFEADDLLGSIVEKVKNKKDIEVIIASGDMDTLQLVDGQKVRVYTLKKGIKDTIIYDEDAVRERFGFGPEQLPDFKGLRGDPSDNIIGIKGIGEKTATLLIQKFGTIENIYDALEKDELRFKKAGIKERVIELLKLNKEEAVFSRVLAEIRRDALDKYELPKKEWRDSFVLERAQKIFSELGFRSLDQRMKEVFLGGGPSLKMADIRQKSLNEAQQDISPDEIKKTGIALWLLASDTTNPSLDDIFRFAGTRSFEKARDYILGEIKKREMQKIYEIEIKLIPVIEKIEKRGIKIDIGFLKKLSKEYGLELKKLEENIWEYAGEKFNVNSPKQLGEILFEKMALKVKNLRKTPGGARSTRESELLKMREAHPIIDEILKYRELQKLLSTYIDNIPQMVDKNDRLHTNLIQTGTTTGRMSSANPNLQNVPIRTDLGSVVRDAFVAEKNFKLASFDYSQIELRVAAILSKDKNLLEIFKKGEDAHESVATKVFGVGAEKIDREMRRRAKIINFGILYGMGVNLLRQNLGVSKEDARKFLDKYFQTFSGLAEYIENIKESTAKKGYTETLFGRRRYFEGIQSVLPYIRAEAERMAINASIQGTQADIVKLAMVKIDEYIKENKFEDKIFPLLQIHDELLYEIKKELVEKVCSDIEKIMENVLDPKLSEGVKLEVNVFVGDRWGSMKKIA